MNTTSHSPRPIPSPQPSNIYSPPTDFDYIDNPIDLTYSPVSSNPGNDMDPFA